MQNESDMTPKGSARRAAILEAAAALFLENGYERTSLDSILERTGGSKASVYANFGSKAGLFRMVVLELCDEMFASLSGGIPANEGPKEVLNKVAQRFLKILWGSDVLALSRIVYAEGGRNPEIADVFFENGYEEGYRQLADYLGLISTGLSDDTLLELSRMFLTMLPGDAYDRLLAGCSVQRSHAELERQIAISVEWLLWKLGRIG